MSVLIAVALVAGALPRLGGAQSVSTPRAPAGTGSALSYEDRYGAPTFWSLSDLVQGRFPPKYQAFWTRGTLRAGLKLCVDGEGESALACFPLAGHFTAEIADAVTFQGSWRAGDEAKVVGVVADPTELPPPPADPGSRPEPQTPAVTTTQSLFFWSFESGPPLHRHTSGEDATTTLEALVTTPARFEGKVVTVRGRFRGANLFADLPEETRRRPSDWVLGDGPFSVWVSGRAPRGPGWALDSASRGDTGGRLEVTARVERRQDAVVLVADKIRLLGPARDP